MSDLESGGQSHWIPLSDLMTGLMMIFMLIAAMYMLRVEQTTTLVVREYQVTREDLLRALQDTFSKDLKQWNAEFLGDMTLRFNNPDVLFAIGSSELRPAFKSMLGDFFPRYLKILTDPKFKSSVKEIRIEGHTSSFWRTAPPEQAYFLNMELSQARTRAVLEFLLKLDACKDDQEWLKTNMTANGLSSSRPIKARDGTVDEIASQRVEIRLVSNAEERMATLAKGVVAR
jgi:outer membrane protein OmpA-like peptidoglycan-associated protein